MKTSRLTELLIANRKSAHRHRILAEYALNLSRAICDFDVLAKHRIAGGGPNRCLSCLERGRLRRVEERCLARAALTRSASDPQIGRAGVEDDTKRLRPENERSEPFCYLLRRILSGVGRSQDYARKGMEKVLPRIGVHMPPLIRPRGACQV